jgi:hypothetical protein
MNELEKMVMKLTVQYAQLELKYFEALQKIKDLEDSLREK